MECALKVLSLCCQGLVNRAMALMACFIYPFPSSLSS
jgi:hypothetical protein